MRKIEVFKIKNMVNLTKEKTVEDIIFSYQNRANECFNARNFRGLTEEEEKIFNECVDIPITDNESRILWEQINFKEKAKWDTRNNKFGKCIELFDSHYIDGYTFKQFCTSIANSKKFSSAMNIFKRTVTSIVEDFKINGIDNSIEHVKAMVMHHMVYEKWIGFRFEYNIKVKIESYGFKVLKTTQHMDRIYKIDIVIESLCGKKIGIQCKSQTFLNRLKEDWVKKNISGQRLAILDNAVDEVYYLFHTQNGDVARILERSGGFGKGVSKCLITVDSILESYKLTYEDIDSKAVMLEEEMDKFRQVNNAQEAGIIDLVIKKAHTSWSLDRA